MADASFTNLRINPNVYLGLEFNKYKSQLYKLAITNPEEYYNIREKVQTSIQTNAIKALYDTFYFALTEGKEADGKTALGLPIAPNVPLQTINEICLNSCTTLNKIIENEVLELLLPIDYSKIMSARLADKGAARTMGDI